VLTASEFILNAFGFAMVALGGQTFVQSLSDKMIEPDFLTAALFGIAVAAGRQLHRDR